MSYLKRQQAPKNWPIPRKGTAYVVKPKSGAIPLLIVFRDMLKVLQNRKEMKKIIQDKLILVNNRIARDETNGVNLFDTISIIPSKKYYRVELDERGKFNLEEIKESETNHKVSKIVDKKILKGKKMQLNLIDGNNFISNIKCNPGDSALISFREKKIEKCLPLIEGAKVAVFAGKHAGKKGVIEKISPEEKMVSLKTKDGNINALIKQIMVID